MFESREDKVQNIGGHAIMPAHVQRTRHQLHHVSPSPSESISAHGHTAHSPPSRHRLSTIASLNPRHNNAMTYPTPKHNAHVISAASNNDSAIIHLQRTRHPILQTRSHPHIQLPYRPIPQPWQAPHPARPLLEAPETPPPPKHCRHPQEHKVNAAAHHPAPSPICIARLRYRARGEPMPSESSCLLRTVQGIPIPIRQPASRPAS